MKGIYNRVTYRKYIDIPEDYLRTDVESLISVDRTEDVLDLRQDLIRLLWGNAGLPESLPVEVDLNWQESRMKDLSSLSSIDRIVVSMDYGIQSIVFHFHPMRKNHSVVLYHLGHQQEMVEHKMQIGQLLDNGYDVVVFSMPLVGPNNQPFVELPRQGFIQLTSHEQMKLLVPRNGSPIRYFVEPVVVVINELQRRASSDRLAMIGISGGGWTTVLVAAVDPRIRLSFPVAGSLPIFLRSQSVWDWGDYEQTDPTLSYLVNDLELYLMGSIGNGRKQLQIINQYDPVCFGGRKSQVYSDIVRNRVQGFGAGEYDLFLDRSHREHQVSPVAIQRILRELHEADMQ
jgi:hypothetical protein